MSTPEEAPSGLGESVTSGSPDRLTFAVTPHHGDILREVKERDGLTKTDVVNRAISRLAFLVDMGVFAGYPGENGQNKQLILRDQETGSEQAVHMLI